jgi:hypothetical protein
VLEPITRAIPRRFRTVRGLVQPLVKLPRTGTHDLDMTLCRDPRALSHILDVWFWPILLQKSGVKDVLPVPTKF